MRLASLSKANFYIASMPKVILILLAFAISVANAQKDITYDFKDAYFLSKVRSMVGKKNHEPIYDTDVAKFTKLDFYEEYVNNLAGIEHFKNLKFLIVGTQGLKSLDVSNNKALEILYARNNNLTSFDVSENTALRELSIGNNQLTSLDVSKNTALRVLYIESNKLTSLDVSKNTALRKLNIGNNKLASLDISKNTALDKLDVHRNQLTSLDVSKNKALYELDVHDNYLTMLDISNNPLLKRRKPKEPSRSISEGGHTLYWPRFNCSENLMPSKAAVKGFEDKWEGIFKFDPQRVQTDMEKISK